MFKTRPAMRTTLVMIAILLSWFIPLAWAEEADTVIVGDIYTVDPQNPSATTLAIKDGTFIYVGDEKGVAPFQGDNTTVMRLAPATMVLPSFTDSHCHGAIGGLFELFQVQLSEGKNLADYQNILRRHLADHPDTTFLRGIGWINGAFPETGPTRQMLDEISKDIPIALSSEDGHSLWTNTKTLEKIGFDADTPDIEGGVIQRDPVTRFPCGFFRDSATFEVFAKLPPYTIEQYKQGIQYFHKKAAALGITAYYDPILDFFAPHDMSILEAYKELENEGLLLIRTRAGFHFKPVDDIDKRLADFIAIGKHNKGSLFEIGALKVFLDGVVEGKTALLSDDYANQPGYKGTAIWNQGKLNELAAKADSLGVQIHAHATGDGAVGMGVNACEYANKMNGERDRRFTLAHLNLVDPSDVKRMSALKMITAPSPYWFMIGPGYYEEVEVPYLGRNRAEREYPMKDYFDGGVIAAVASDYPVTKMITALGAIQLGATRAYPPGSPAQNPGQRVTVEQMIQASTINGAYANFAEETYGSIEVGKKADLVILDRDITNISPVDIFDTVVLKTMVNGSIIYEDPKHQ